MINKTFVLIIALITVGISGLALALNEDNSSLLSENGLFEGDLKIPESLIREHYNMSGMEELEQGSNRSRRAATASKVRLWRNRIVPYVIPSSFSYSERVNISNAIKRWQDFTCLRFVKRKSSHKDYIHFQSTDSGCYSYVGRKGGKQVINLQKPECVAHGKVLHEIGHAIGFWHEQSRPDRDGYVRINLNNIKRGKERQFMKRKDSEIDSLGSSYDYGSIMHYSDTAFVKDDCPGCKTIEVSNNSAYLAQGSPRLGQRTDLSISDIQQAKRLYSCELSDIYRTFTINVKYGTNLKDTSWFWNTYPYVVIVAFDLCETKYTEKTTTEIRTLYPSWYQTLRFKRGYWKYFQIRVWNSGWFWDDPMSETETVVVKQGDHYDQKHCDSSSCSGYITYDYSLV